MIKIIPLKISIFPKIFNNNQIQIDISPQDSKGFKIHEEIALTFNSFFKSQIEVKKQKVQTIRLAIETPVKTDAFEEVIKILIKR